MNSSNINDGGIVAQGYERFITQKEAAEYLQVSQSVLVRWRVNGGGPPYIKMVDIIRYRLSGVQHFKSVMASKGR